MSRDNVQNEPSQADPLRVANDSAAQAWLHGYADGYGGHDVHEPEQYKLEYYKGYIEGLRSLRS